MSDKTESFESYERTQRLVEALLNGEQPEPWPELTEQEADMVRVAGVLNSAGAGARPSPEFVKALASRLEDVSAPPSRRLWSRLTRRGFLRGLASAAGLLVAGALGGRAVTSLGRADPGGGWVMVARGAELLPGTAIRFIAAGREGYLLNLDGALSAVSALCTHLPCVLQWSGGQREFICPCHQAEFAPDGRHIPTPNYDRQLTPLATFPVKQIGELVYVFPGGSTESSTPDQSDDGEEYSNTRIRRAQASATSPIASSSNTAKLLP